MKGGKPKHSEVDVDTRAARVSTRLLLLAELREWPSGKTSDLLLLFTSTCAFNSVLLLGSFGRLGGGRPQPVLLLEPGEENELV